MREDLENLVTVYSETEAAEIAGRLEAQGIPYRVVREGPEASFVLPGSGTAVVVQVGPADRERARAAVVDVVRFDGAAVSAEPEAADEEPEDVPSESQIRAGLARIRRRRIVLGLLQVLCLVGFGVAIDGGRATTLAGPLLVAAAAIGFSAYFVRCPRCRQPFFPGRTLRWRNPFRPRCPSCNLPLYGWKGARPEEAP